jgi:hypothetical protein
MHHACPPTARLRADDPGGLDQRVRGAGVMVRRDGLRVVASILKIERVRNQNALVASRATRLGCAAVGHGAAAEEPGRSWRQTSVAVVRTGGAILVQLEPR